MKRLIGIIILGFTILCGVSWAGINEHRALAIELLELLRANDVVTLKKAQYKEIELQKQPNLRLFEDTVTQFFDKYLGYETVEPLLIQHYMDGVTESEMREIVDFYTSPVGHKALTSFRVLNNDAMLAAHKIMLDNIDELNQELAIALKNKKAALEKAKAK